MQYASLLSPPWLKSVRLQYHHHWQCVTTFFFWNFAARILRYLCFTFSNVIFSHSYWNCLARCSGCSLDMTMPGETTIRLKLRPFLVGPPFATIIIIIKRPEAEGESSDIKLHLEPSTSMVPSCVSDRSHQGISRRLSWSHPTNHSESSVSCRSRAEAAMTPSESRHDKKPYWLQTPNHSWGAINVFLAFSATTISTRYYRAATICKTCKIGDVY